MIHRERLAAIEKGIELLVAPWDPLSPPFRFPFGLEWVGVALVGIGASHIVTYAVGRRREREESRSW